MITKLTRVFGFILSIIDICSKYAWVPPLKYKKGDANALQNILNEFN